jgi:hypothetical protein
MIVKLASSTFDRTWLECVDELIVGVLGACVSKYIALEGPYTVFKFQA